MELSDRFDASVLLAQRLQPYRSLKPLILVARRDTLALGESVADALNSDGDILLVQPLVKGDSMASAPDGDETFRFGGTGWWWPQLLVQRRPSLPGQPVREIRDSVIILVDDGATDEVTLGTIASLLRRAAPRRFVAALVVAGDEMVNALVCRVDELVCLLAAPPPDDETLSRVGEELAALEEEDFAMAFDALVDWVASPGGNLAPAGEGLASPGEGLAFPGGRLASRGGSLASPAGSLASPGGDLPWWGG